MGIVIIVHNSYDSEFQQSTILLTLGAHAQEGYSSCFVCLSVCLSVTTLAAASFSSMIKLRYAGLQLVDFQKNALFKSYGIICLP